MEAACRGRRLPHGAGAELSRPISPRHRQAGLPSRRMDGRELRIGAASAAAAPQPREGQRFLGLPRPSATPMAEPNRYREPLAARTKIPLSFTLAHQLQRPRNVSVSVL